MGVGTKLVCSAKPIRNPATGNTKRKEAREPPPLPCFMTVREERRWGRREETDGERDAEELLLGAPDFKMATLVELWRVGPQVTLTVQKRV